MNSELFTLKGRRVLVTGGGRGLGRAMAAGMSAAGGRVALVARTSQQVEQAVKEIGSNAAGVVGDVCSESRSDLVDRVEEVLGGTIDVVLHAAGTQHRQPAEEFDRDAWDRVLDVNLTAPFLLSQEIGRRQLAAGQPGSHIFVGSLTSRLAVRDVIAYTASKSGLYGVARGLSEEWAGAGIRANAIGPGYFRTEMTDSLFHDADRYQKMLDRIPMGRFGDPEELAGTAVFLASDASSYITGQLLMVDGGWTAH